MKYIVTHRTGPGCPPGPPPVHSGVIVTWNLLAIAVGGALGALARYGLVQLAHRYLVSSYWATIVANVVGCFCIGLAFRFLVAGGEQSIGAQTPWLRYGIITGLLGALTTFSTFSLETIHLIQQGSYGQAAFNLVGSVILGLIAVLLGLTLCFTSSLPSLPDA